jgi:hypothetical protein
MRIQGGGSGPTSTRIESPRPEPKPASGTPGTPAAPTPGRVPSRDSFVRATPAPATPRPPVAAGPSATPAPVFRVVGDALVPAPVAATTASAPAQGLRPDVEEAVRQIEAYPPPMQAGELGRQVGSHGGEGPEDVEFRTQLMQELGPDRVGEMLANAPPIDGIYSRGQDVRGVLAAAAEVYSPEEQGGLVQRLGSEQLGRAMALGVYDAGLPNQDPARTAEIRAQLESVARLLGSVYALPPGSPGRDELTGALDRLRDGQEPLLGQTPGEEVAAWMVARSGEDTLKIDFAEGYLADFRSDPSSLSPTEARSVALVLGSMEPPSRALAPILGSLDAQQRRAFLSTMTKASYGETPEWSTPYLFNQDMAEGVTTFLMDVARLNPATFGDPEAAQDFRVEAFRAGIQALDNDLFNGEQGLKDALANMFTADTAGIIHDLSDSGGPNWDVEGRDLARFFDQVAFRNDGVSRQWVVDAMKSYLGVGAGDGVADLLAANKGDSAFMAERGNVMAREMGFLLGALHQGAQQALGRIDGEYERKKAVIDVIGSIAETAIEASPAAAAYKTVKSGSGGKVEVGTVFDWLAETYLGQSVKASKDNVTRLSDSMISNVWAEFFDDDSLTGARSEDLVNLYALINAGVALADGSVQPSIRIGG